MSPSKMPGHSEILSFDPTVGASRAGYREISGDVPTSGTHAILRSWAIVFDTDESARSHYQTIVELLGKVDGDGRATTRLSDDHIERYGSLSERYDLLGELATIWVTASSDVREERGAVLASADSTCVHLLEVAPYSASGEERAVRVMEHMAVNMAGRQANIDLPPRADTMARLPTLEDIDGSWTDATITNDRYMVGN